MTKAQIPVTIIYNDQKSKKKTHAEVGQSLASIINTSDILLSQSCSGKAKCLECLVRLEPYDDNSLMPAEFDEIHAIGNVFHLTHKRLACQCRIKGPITIIIDSKKKNE